VLPRCQICEQKLSVASYVWCSVLAPGERVYPVHTLTNQLRSRTVRYICRECWERGQFRFQQAAQTGEEILPLEAPDWIPPVPARENHAA
jgi:hypothetical protein